MWLEGDFGSLSLSTKGSHSPAWGPQGEASPSPKGEPKTEPQDEWKDSTKRRALRRERRKMIEKGMLQKVTWDVRDLGCGDQGQAAEPEPKPEVPSARAREGGLVPSLQVGVSTAHLPSGLCPAASHLPALGLEPAG
jgi:hypothetical protein